MDGPRVPECARAARRLVGVRQGKSFDTGWTVVELLLSLTVLAAVTIGTTLLLVPVVRQARLHREVESADIAARGFLEELQTLRARAIVERYPPGTEVEVRHLPSGTATLTYVDPTANPLEIRVRLQWSTPDLGPMDVELLTARAE